MLLGTRLMDLFWFNLNKKKHSSVLPFNVRLVKRSQTSSSLCLLFVYSDAVINQHIIICGHRQCYTQKVNLKRSETFTRSTAAINSNKFMYSHCSRASPLSRNIVLYVNIHVRVWGVRNATISIAREQRHFVDPLTDAKQQRPRNIRNAFLIDNIDWQPPLNLYTHVKVFPKISISLS